MPFIPLSPEEKEKTRSPCNHPEHNPPTHFLITQTVKWQCPACGRTLIIVPPIVRW
jgi:predicted RNA-binding Zn-ribbon protein involved in translation (DUF1610 family)